MNKEETHAYLNSLTLDQLQLIQEFCEKFIIPLVNEMIAKLD